MSATFFNLLNRAPCNKGAKIKSNSEVKLSKGDIKSFGDLIVSREIVSKLLEKQYINQKTLLRVLYNKWISLAWGDFVKPNNPRIQIQRNGKLDSTIVFQVKDAFPGLNEFKSDDDPKTAIIERLTSGEDIHALSETDAEAFFLECITINDIICVRPINELTHGKVVNGIFVPATRAENKAIQKLITMLSTEPGKDGKITVHGLTAFERNLVLSKESEIEVKDPRVLWAKIFKYAKNIYQFRRILEVLKPVILFSHSKFAISDSEKEKTERMMEYVNKIFNE